MVTYIFYLIIIVYILLLRAQERPATLILTVTSGWRLTRARHVYNRDAETGNWNFDLQLRTIGMQKMCQSQQLSHGIVAAVFMGSKLLSPFCHPGSNFRGKSKTRGSSTIFFSLELELGTYINLYSFESSIERPFRDIFSFRLNKNFGLRRTGRASRTHA